MSYYLPSNQNSGTVYGVGVSYNPQTWANVRGTYNPTLKSRLEEFAVRAALSRGFSAVRIVSMFHSTTINSYGQTVPAPLHCTIHAGNGQIRAHIEVTGLNPNANPLKWYDNLTMTQIKWSDRQTASNAPSASGSQGGGSQGGGSQGGGSQGGGSQGGGSQGGGSPPQAGGSSQGARWVPTGSSVPGQQWTYWDGTKYTGRYA